MKVPLPTSFHACTTKRNAIIVLKEKLSESVSYYCIFMMIKIQTTNKILREISRKQWDTGRKRL